MESHMSNAVQFDHYGDVNVLNVVDVPLPVAKDNEITV
jgi:hypothetical protein